MLVLKFGGTSVGSVKNMTIVKNIIQGKGQVIVVLSAMSGTTNALEEISNAIKNGNLELALNHIVKLRASYVLISEQLLDNPELKLEVTMCFDVVFTGLNTAVYGDHTPLLHNSIVGQGENLSTFLFNSFLIQEGLKTVLLPALEFMRVDANNAPDSFYIKQNLNRLINHQPPADIYITQGFISLNVDGDITNLSRGGSDYTATLIAAAIQAREVQIWTDIDGFHNNDPRFVNNTKAISRLSFDEAAELAYFGAKILHPQTVLPVRDLGIPVRLKNTTAPEALGTLITNEMHGDGIKAIAAKDGIVAIKIKSARMLLAYGFLKKVFEIFEKYKTPIDMVTTSEVAVSLTIDNDIHINAIVNELKDFANVDIDEFMSIVCLVGNAIIYHPDTPRLFDVLQDVNVRMIAYGGSNNNISLLVNTNDKVETLRKLHRYVFEPTPVFA